MISPEGIQWINQKVGHETFQEEPSTPPFHGSRGGYSVQTPADIYSDLGFVPLPSKEAAISLLNAYFRTINHYCPLFDERDFMSRIEQEYPVHPQSSPEWWACVSVTLALAYTLDPRYYQHGWIYLRNSMLSLNGFYVGRPQLCSVQAVLGMALYFLGTFSLRPSIELNALAMCMAYSLDLSTDLSTQTASEIEQSRKVLAVCCSMDIDIALRSRTPPIQHSIDMTFYHRPIDQNGVFNIYDSVRHLTIIKNQIYQKLYSTLGSEKGDAEVIDTVGELDVKLQDWVDEIPHEYQPGHFNKYSDSRDEIGPILLYIHLSYYNCLLIIHRKAIARADWNMSLDPCRSQFPQVRSPNPRTLQSSTLCTQAARASMQLVREIPGDNIICAGTLMYFAVFALVIFSILIVKDPSVANPKRDIEMMKDVEKFFFAVSRSNAGPGIDQLIQYCISHRAAAEMAIKRALKSTTGSC
ncbi:hypothetical protein ASPWEDRAFT_173520 [Aspergillus wentii DTO 134E9]|uniref:Xylanolytic transcriptional activator regulatory domain-containing protein n=1 Tax=Aspergillus wentii DTO 134E9 TaxID=1073089 RepID=A0A1L9RGV1_ASPWE|nr:uncharacterized protein ASPWEDRAFT_173520 [Aspergillus wentii DTO 134E9]KAI9927869.1 hypothetical protein MW887_002721 [Aspergillus wentii]OJJ34088.1 hypothetical protein ASPWEDRAFT_173520 [Aspergillus wentii DTO 134E9]